MKDTRKPAEPERCDTQIGWSENLRVFCGLEKGHAGKHDVYFGKLPTPAAPTPARDECARCGETMFIRDGDEPTEICDHCAHESIVQMQAALQKFADELEGDPLLSSRTTMTRSEVANRVRKFVQSIARPVEKKQK